MIVRSDEETSEVHITGGRIIGKTLMMQAAFTAHHARAWGLTAARHGLVVIEADAESILVSDPKFQDAHGYRISLTELRHIRDTDLPFADAARKIAHRHP